MKVEKISETQLKFILNASDLQDRDIRVTELAYGSAKTQQLFREMMEQAMQQCNFNSDNTPLMIEAVPIAQDSIMIIVTKVADTAASERHLDILENIRQARNKLHKIKHSDLLSEKQEPLPPNPYSVYAFSSLDEAADAAIRLLGYFTGHNALYKNNGKYFLVLHNVNQQDHISSEDLETILNEYGQKYFSSALSEAYLEEYGEKIIKEGAIHILGTYLR